MARSRCHPPRRYVAGLELPDDALTVWPFRFRGSRLLDFTESESALFSPLVVEAVLTTYDRFWRMGATAPGHDEQPTVVRGFVGLVTPRPGERGPYQMVGRVGYWAAVLVDGGRDVVIFGEMGADVEEVEAVAERLLRATDADLRSSDFRLHTILRDEPPRRRGKAASRKG